VRGRPALNGVKSAAGAEPIDLQDLSRPLHGLALQTTLDPTDKSVGYFQSWAADFRANPPAFAGYLWKFWQYRLKLIHSQVKTSYLEDQTSNLQERTSHLEDQTSRLQVKTSHLEDQTSNLQEKTSYLKDQTSQLQEKTSYLEDQTSQLQEKTSYLKDQTSQLQEKTSYLEDQISTLRVNSFRLRV